ncbi:MAG: DUF1109 family protein [Alphaproteobacteria bacterium]|nr:DUF1109 family protein [Alphaproteobacteria bacterium]
MTHEKDINAFIEGICQTYQGVKPLNCSVRCSWLTALISAGWVALMLPFYGVRYDWAEAITNPVFLLETGGVLFIWVTALMAASLLRVPDMGGQRFLLSLPLLMMGVIALWVLYRSLTEGMDLEFSWHHCCENGIVFGAVPLLLLTYLSRMGTTTHPYLMALMNSLAVGSAGWVGLRLTCPMEDVGHGFIYHFLPFVMIGSLFVLLARRLFRW